MPEGGAVIEINRNSRVDELGRAFAGSQLQVQIYLARRQSELSEAVQQALSKAGVETSAIRWTAPLETHRFQEPVDQAFLSALGLGRHVEALKKFWPSGGPNWDALGVIEKGIHPEAALLVEAKSYPGEVYGGGCKATSPRSRDLIATSIARAQRWLDISDATDWMGKLYQYGNRLAHLYFLREVIGIEAWLVNLCFTDDVSTTPTTVVAWRFALPRLKRELGFQTEQIPWVIDVMLPARSRAELCGIDEG